MTSIYEELLITLHGLWNRRWLALAIAWGVCVLGWLVVSLIPNRYESRAHILVETQSILPGKVGITPADQQKEVDTVRQTLVSAGNLEKVVRGTDLSRGVASDGDMAAKIVMLRDGIRIQSPQDNVLEISATLSGHGLSDGANARLSAAVVGRLIDLFVSQDIAGDRAETSRTLKFLDKQIDERGRQLAAAEQKQAEFEQKYMGLLPGSGSVADRMAAARSEMNDISSQIVAAQSALSAMNGQLAATPASIAGAAPGGGQSALGAAQAQLAQAKANGWTDDHPDVIALRRQIASLSASGHGVAAAGVANPAYMSVKAMQAERAGTVAALQSRRAQIQADLNAMIARQSAEPGVAAEQAQIARDYQVQKAQYDKLLADREDIRLRGDVQSQTGSVSFRVIDPPSVPRVPTAPNRPLLLLGVLVAGVAAGIGAAFVQGQLQTSYPTAARLEKATGLSVIGSISEALTATQRERSQRKLRWFLGASGGLVGMFLLLLAIEFVQRGMMA